MKNRKIVYISKSKVGNPDDLMKVRHQLAKFDCEVKEFMGGNYGYEDREAVASADVLIVVPPTIGKCNVGKGQYCEVDLFIQATKNYPHTVVGFMPRGEIILDGISDCEEFDTTDWVRSYGLLSTDNDPSDMIDVLEENGIKPKLEDLPESKSEVLLATYKLIKP